MEKKPNGDLSGKDKFVRTDFKNSIGKVNAKLIVFDDDFNSFDCAIQSIMEICNYTFIQSDQLSLLVHYKGEAVVKMGDFNHLKLLQDAFNNRGFSALVKPI